MDGHPTPLLLRLNLSEMGQQLLLLEIKVVMGNGQKTRGIKDGREKRRKPCLSHLAARFRQRFGTQQFLRVAGLISNLQATMTEPLLSLPPPLPPSKNSLFLLAAAFSENNNELVLYLQQNAQSQLALQRFNKTNLKGGGQLGRAMRVHVVRTWGVGRGWTWQQIMIYNNKIIQMDLKAKPISHIFQSVIQMPWTALDCGSVTLSSFLQLKHAAPHQNKIVLKDNLLLISKQKDGQAEYTCGLVLEDGVTFQRIYAEAGEGPEANRLKGFRIINSKREYAEIIISFEGLAKIWIRELAKFINEVGFHLVYQTLRKIGKGSTACVYEIRRIEDKELFAAKVVLKAYLQQKEERAKSLSQEIAFLRAMDHENIIKLYGVFESDQAVYLIFERLQGGNLVQRINRQKGFSLEQIKQIMKGVTEGLAYLHKFDIAHRDIKLQNIIFRDEDSLHPVIADFGLAIQTEDEPYLFYRCGTPGYVAPEIIRMREHKKVKVACDIFSAGVIFHILLTNRYLFEGKSNDQIYKSNCEAKFSLEGDRYDHIDEEALCLLRKMLAVKVSERITADEILEEPFLELCAREKEEISPAITEAGQSYTF